jgi:hypothetical protein
MPSFLGRAEQVQVVGAVDVNSFHFTVGLSLWMIGHEKVSSWPLRV